jgi:hypothetical protein
VQPYFQQKEGVMPCFFNRLGFLGVVQSETLFQTETSEIAPGGTELWEPGFSGGFH